MAEDTRRFWYYEHVCTHPSPFLRYYVWQQTAITVGFTQGAYARKNLHVFEVPSHQIAVRPTGGGIVFHRPGDLTYALYVPLQSLPCVTGTMEDVFMSLSQPLLDTLAQFGCKGSVHKSTQAKRKGRRCQNAMCFADVEGYEIQLDGKKILGQAQRKGRQVLLAQGTFQNLPLKENQYDPFVSQWGIKIVEALRAWGANSRASANSIPALETA